ncbi:hypothetical protein CLAFUW4_05312 [Fulvia fulva]|uniref:Uncharacterized protein n=1 Tax=Passalora fulva TaxID=5499 RepID=A0A9Q8LHT5_PASFU|nr:uncharacterized protein CLAFUR5_05459 [Fulvia fulva]KAK4623843.1 hypothetical protein CLAFUR4_05306 [Fulvia fulva]KAK4625464.1 hypothetical protein CLAFUR0_05313 [Fulvia fulva]UJO17901.1 hypothetical protein CLAFUR5_05459 [Fulvia fulva]WPV15444.1 hypothetical protein CLAFUW4_05312 [Fulvia fulva]WPV29623.1 hypothetical protein CLAFUW7_05311 [Fulvia fulva]
MAGSTQLVNSRLTLSAQDLTFPYRTITETNSMVIPTTTKYLSTTQTSTRTTIVDLWTASPACTAVPKFEWVRDWRSQRSQRTADLVKAACSCIEIPESTSTTLAIATSTPTVTITEGITGLAEVTAVETQVVVHTHTKFTFLSNEMKVDLANRTVVLNDKSLVLPRIDRVGAAHQSNRSSRAGPGAMMAGVVRHIGAWKHAIS